MKKLQVYGTGCPKCQQVAEAAENAAKELGVDYELEKVTNINDIVAAGIMNTPALAIDGEIKISGKVPSVEEVKDLIG